MQNNTLISVLQATQGVKTVKVKFSNNGEAYTYKTILNLTPGQFVVVEVKSAFSVAKVVAMDSIPDVLNDQIELKWVVQIVNTDWVDSIRAEELRIQQQLALGEAKRRMQEVLGDIQIDMPVLLNAT